MTSNNYLRMTNNKESRLENKKNVANDTIHNVSHSCFDCIHCHSSQPDVVNFLYCDEKDRDWTFSHNTSEKDSTEICKLFEEW